MLHPKRVSVIVKNDGDCDSVGGNDHIGEQGDQQITTFPSRGSQQREAQSQSQPLNYEICESKHGAIEECNMITGALILDGEDDGDHDIGGNGNGDRYGNIVGSTSSDHQCMMNISQNVISCGENNSSKNHGNDGDEDDGVDIYNVVLRTIEVETTPDFANGSEEEVNDLNTIPPSVNMDITTIDEMIELFDEMKRKNYNLKICTFALSLVFIIVTLCLSHCFYQLQRGNKKLMSSLERLESEKVELEMIRDRLLLEARVGSNAVLVEQELGLSDGATSVFEMNNCYLNFRTNVALGQCTKDLYDKFNDWYYSHDGKYEEKKCSSKIWSKLASK